MGDESHPSTKERQRSTVRWNCRPIERKSHRLGLQKWQSLCAQRLCGELCAVRSAHLQKIAETVSRALAYLTDRLILPYCLPLMADRCMMLHYEIEWAHEAYMRCAERNAANRILSGLHDRLTRLLDSLLDERDHTPRNRSGNNEVIPVQDWLATSGGTQPPARRRGRSGSSAVPKGSVVTTVQANLLELSMRLGYCNEHGLSGGVTRPSEPVPTAVANEAAPHQTDADAASARGPSSSGPIMAGVDWSDLDHGLSDFDHGYDDDDEYEDDYEAIWDDETTWGKGSTAAPTTETIEDEHIATSLIFCSGSFTPSKADPCRRSVS